MPSDELLQTVRASLEEEAEHLRSQLRELGFDESGSALSFDDNFADSGQVAAEQGEARTLANTIRDQLAEVERALGKIGEGRYGLCEVCEAPIGEARIEAIPTAKYCIDCAR